MSQLPIRVGALGGRIENEDIAIRYFHMHAIHEESKLALLLLFELFWWLGGLFLLVYKGATAASDFFPVNLFSMQQEIQEEETVQAALIQVASEKMAAQHGLLLRRKVTGVKLEVAHCLKMEAVHWLSLRLQCENVISRVFQALFQTILFLRLVLIESSCFLYTFWIQVLVVRIDFSHVCA